MNLDHQHFTSLELVLAETLVGGFVADVAHSFSLLPPFVTGGIGAFFVGVCLRVLDPSLRLVGEKILQRVSNPPGRPTTRVVAKPVKEDEPEDPDLTG